MLKVALSDPAGPIVEIDLADNDYINADVEAKMKQFLAEIKQGAPQFNIWQQKKRVFNVSNDTISVTDFDYRRKDPSQPIPAYLFFDRGLRDINDLVSLQIQGNEQFYAALNEMFQEGGFPRNLRHLVFDRVALLTREQEAAICELGSRVTSSCKLIQTFVLRVPLRE